MNERETRQAFQNTDRDDATTAKTGLRADDLPGAAAEDQPQWRPPESMPEPRPPEPTLDADAPSV